MAFVVPAALHRARPTAAPPLQVEAAAAQPAAAWEDPDEALWEWTAALSEADADDEADAD